MQENREKTIIRTSIIGILVNVLLAGFKAFVGILSTRWLSRWTPSTT